MGLRGVKVYGTSDRVAFNIDDDNVLHVWPDASNAPSAYRQDVVEGKPWALLDVLVHGTDESLGRT
jgi:hypothetical protein